MSPRSIVHIEIPATDRATTAQFYADLFEWNFDHTEEPVPYTGFRAGNTGGGYPDIGELYQPGDVVIYVESDDIDADLEKIVAHGGTVVMPKDEVQGMGYLAMFNDPAGNRLALWKDTSGGNQAAQ